MAQIAEGVIEIMLTIGNGRIIIITGPSCQIQNITKFTEITRIQSIIIKIFIWWTLILLSIVLTIVGGIARKTILWALGFLSQRTSTVSIDEKSITALFTGVHLQTVLTIFYFTYNRSAPCWNFSLLSDDLKNVIVWAKPT